jgi:hypothetical protein
VVTLAPKAPLEAGEQQLRVFRKVQCVDHVDDDQRAARARAMEVR